MPPSTPYRHAFPQGIISQGERHIVEFIDAVSVQHATRVAATCLEESDVTT
jgi:hypothetical protein